MHMTNRKDAQRSRWEAARDLKVSVRTIDRYLADGLLPKIKVGPRKVLIPAEAIETMLAGERS